MIRQQNPYVLTLYLGVSPTSLFSVSLMTLIIFSTDKEYEAGILFTRKPLHVLTRLTAIIAYLAIYTGASVGHIKSNLAYSVWSIPSGDIVPHNVYDWVQFSYRDTVLIVSIWIMITPIHAIGNYSDNRAVCYGYTVSSVLVILQVTTGALSVMANVNLIIVLPHALFITYLFGTIVYLILLTLRTTRSQE